MEKLEQKEITIWENGKTYEYSYKFKIKQIFDTLKEFLTAFFKEKELNRALIKTTKIYNEKGIELDDFDVKFLKDKEIIYFSTDGSSFKNVNYFNRYQFIKPIKKGGYGEVHLAKNVLTDEEVTIKKVDVNYFSTDDLYNISREPLYLSNFVHKNIIKLYGSFTYENYVYTVMPFCKGGELTQFCSENSNIPEKSLKNYFSQIQDGVRYIHGQNVTHRDLKPNNILFLDKEKTHLVIIDFGISGTCNGKNREIIKSGTIQFTPPEIAVGEEYQSSTKIDIWALGVILYLMVFKTFPFKGNNAELRKQICFKQLTFPPKYKKIKKSLFNLLKGLLEKDPEVRIDINSPLFEAWYNDESDIYENVQNKLSVLTFGDYNKKYMKRFSIDCGSKPPVNLPRYLQNTQNTENRKKSIRTKMTKTPVKNKLNKITINCLNKK